MGTGTSKFSAGGSLKGAYPPPLPGVNLEDMEKLDPKVKRYAISVPEGKGGGDTIVATLRGEDVSLTIPNEFHSEKASQPRPIRPGDKFVFEHGDRNHVMTSTLPTLPGTAIVQVKPILWANASHTFHVDRGYDKAGMSHKMNELVEEVQTILQQKTVEVGCNAILGITCSISTDSAGEKGKSKIVLVTMMGTPCVVLPLDSDNSSHIPLVQHKRVVPTLSY